MVQFGIALRTNDIVDTDAANTFESDNDASGSTAEPFTHGIFSNISAFGPAITATNPATLAAKHADGSAIASAPEILVCKFITRHFLAGEKVFVWNRMVVRQQLELML